MDLTRLRRRWLVFAIASLLVISLTVALIVNPIIQTNREDFSALEPVASYAYWSWLGGVNFEFDLQPMTKTMITPSFPQLGRLSGGIYADLNVPEPTRQVRMPPGGLQSLGYIGGWYDKDGVPFSDGMSFVSGSYLNHKPQNITTELNVNVASNSDTNSLASGHLLFFLNGTLLKESEFDLFYRDTGVGVMYLDFKDLTNNTLTLLWTGSATIHVLGQTTFTVSAQSADFTVRLPIVESCVVEKHLSTYLGLGYPKLRDCEFSGYKELPAAN